MCFAKRPGRERGFSTQTVLPERPGHPRTKAAEVDLISGRFGLYPATLHDESWKQLAQFRLSNFSIPRNYVSQWIPCWNTASRGKSSTSSSPRSSLPYGGPDVAQKYMLFPVTSPRNSCRAFLHQKEYCTCLTLTCSNFFWRGGTVAACEHDRSSQGWGRKTKLWLYHDSASMPRICYIVFSVQGCEKRSKISRSHDLGSQATDARGMSTICSILQWSRLWRPIVLNDECLDDAPALSQSIATQCMLNILKNLRDF